MTVFEMFTAGFLAPFRGIGVALRPGVRRWAVLPFTVTVLVLLGGFAFGLAQLISFVPVTTGWVMGLMGLATGAVATTIEWVVFILLWPVFTVVLLYALFLLTKVLVSPFYSFLAERVLVDEGVIPENPFHLTHWVSVSLRMFAVSLVRAALFAVIGVILFLVSMIPVVGLVGAFGLLLIMTFDVSDYSFEAMQMGLSERLRYFFSHFPAFLGFAAALGLVFFVPGLNFVLFPASVAGAADLVRRLAKRVPDSSTL